MKKKNIIMFILMIMLLNFSFVYASESGIVEIIGGGEIKPTEVGDGFAESFLGMFQWCGYAISVGMLVYLGIKYLFISTDGKADLKGSFVKYVIGALLIALATTVASILFNSI